MVDLEFLYVVMVMFNRLMVSFRKLIFTLFDIIVKSMFLLSFNFWHVLNVFISLLCIVNLLILKFSSEKTRFTAIFTTSTFRKDQSIENILGYILT